MITKEDVIGWAKIISHVKELDFDSKDEMYELVHHSSLLAEMINDNNVNPQDYDGMMDCKEVKEYTIVRDACIEKLLNLLGEG